MKRYLLFLQVAGQGHHGYVGFLVRMFLLNVNNPASSIYQLLFKVDMEQGNSYKQNSCIRNDNRIFISLAGNNTLKTKLNLIMHIHAFSLAKYFSIFNTSRVFFKVHVCSNGKKYKLYI